MGEVKFEIDEIPTGSVEQIPTGSVEQIDTGSVKGEPMDRFDNWDACMAWATQQPDIENAEAYCESLKAKECQVKRVEELETAVETLKEYIRESEKTKNEEIEAAKKESTNELIAKIEKTIPSNMIISRFNFGAQRFVKEVKRVVHETK